MSIQIKYNKLLTANIFERGPMPTPAKNFHGVGIGPLSKILAVKGEQGKLKAALNQELETF